MSVRAGLSWTIAVAALLLCATPAQAGPLTFSFDLAPLDGSISGAPGATIGWGYFVDNPSDAWLELSGLDAGTFAQATPDAGLFDFPILAPGGSQSRAFAASLQGLYQLTWDAGAAVGFTNVGQFVITANFWDADPLAGEAIFLGSLTRYIDYSASVTPEAHVPEPGTLVLVASGAAAAVLRRRYRPTFRRG
jgi:PEP-CTERM motif